MRGKVRRAQGRARGQGITPAHAGKSLARARGRSRIQDHPRPCGEKVSAANITGMKVGSPPPMRGKGRQRRFSTGRRRITPAHAGKRELR